MVGKYKTLSPKRLMSQLIHTQNDPGEERKYEVLDELAFYKGHTLCRIRALRDFGDVKKGDLGGFIEGEHNLSHRGKSWVYNNAMVYNFARVEDDAKVKNSAKLHGISLACEQAEIRNLADVGGRTKASGHARILDAAIINGGTLLEYAEIKDAIIKGHVEIHGPADISGKTLITDNAKLRGYVVVCDAMVGGDTELSYHVYVQGGARICGKAKLSHHVYAYGDLYIFGEAELSNYVYVFGGARICGKAKLHDNVMVGKSTICDDARVDNCVFIYDSSTVDDNAELRNQVALQGAVVTANAKLVNHVYVEGGTIGKNTVLRDYITIQGPSTTAIEDARMDNARIYGRISVVNHAKLHRVIMLGEGATAIDDFLLNAYAEACGEALIEVDTDPSTGNTRLSYHVPPRGILSDYISWG